MLKVGERVQLVDNKYNNYHFNNQRGVLGTITEIFAEAPSRGSLGGEVPTAKVIWDNGQNTTQYEANLEKYEEKTEEKMKEREASEHQKHLLAVYENAKFTDFTIICKAEGEEYKFPCHKAVLATNSASDHFARMLEAGMTESSSGEVEVEGYNKEEVEHFIKYFYILKMEEGVIISAACFIIESLYFFTGSPETFGEVLEDG